MSSTAGAWPPNPEATASTLAEDLEAVKGDLSVATGVEYR